MKVWSAGTVDVVGDGGLPGLDAARLVVARLVNVNNVVSNSQGGASRAGGTARGILFCGFLLIFFRAFANVGDRASSRGWCCVLGLRHRQSDPSSGVLIATAAGTPSSTIRHCALPVGAPNLGRGPMEASISRGGNAFLIAVAP